MSSVSFSTKGMHWNSFVQDQANNAAGYVPLTRQHQKVTTIKKTYRNNDN